VILHISIHDIVAEKLIKTIYKDISYEIEHDKGIQLGGFILTISNMNIEIDETLDARLREQKEWFLNHSKLFIRR
jgi:vacuolar-type H+-ATPase subunit E/Vma4